MNQRQIGLILLVISVVLLIFVITNSVSQEKLIQDFFRENGTCFTDEGVCLHNQKSNTLILGSIITAAIFILGSYLVFFDKTQKLLSKQTKEITTVIKKQDSDEKFNAFLSAFNEKEKKVLRAIRLQKGIRQSTLRYKTDTPKTALSLMLKDFEERDIVYRVDDKKTKKVFLKQDF